MLSLIEMMFYSMGVSPLAGWFLIAFVTALVVFLGKISFDLWLYEEETRSYADSIGAHSRTIRKEREALAQQLDKMLDEKLGDRR